MEIQTDADRIRILAAALKAARHDLWLFADGSQQDDEVLRGEVAMRAVDEALAKAGVA